jgi:hypothetical protein
LLSDGLVSSDGFYDSARDFKRMLVSFWEGMRQIYATLRDMIF